MKLLNLTATDRANCAVTFNVNTDRFEVYLASGRLLTEANSKFGLKMQLAAAGITGAKFDGAAQRKYLYLGA